MGPVNTDKDEAETVALTRQMLVVLPQQQQYEEPAALGNYRAISKALVRFDHSSGTSEAVVKTFSQSISLDLSPGVNILPLPPTISGGKASTLDGDWSVGTF